MRTHLIYKTPKVERERGGKTNLERFDRALVEVPTKEELSKTNLIKSLFKTWLPFQLRRRPPFGTFVLSRRAPIHAG
jgi:hypothetical protein